MMIFKALIALHDCYFNCKYFEFGIQIFEERFNVLIRFPQAALMIENKYETSLLRSTFLTIVIDASIHYTAFL